MPGPQVKNWRLYEALRRKRYSKERAAKIANTSQKRRNWRKRWEDRLGR